MTRNSTNRNQLSGYLFKQFGLDISIFFKPVSQSLDHLAGHISIMDKPYQGSSPGYPFLCAGSA